MHSKQIMSAFLGLGQVTVHDLVRILIERGHLYKLATLDINIKVARMRPSVHRRQTVWLGLLTLSGLLWTQRVPA